MACPNAQKTIFRPTHDFVDTGYFLGVLLPNDALAFRAAQWEQRVQEPLFTSEFEWLRSPMR
jgi:hypothetical protein